jgi:hypothetical protein
MKLARVKKSSDSRHLAYIYKHMRSLTQRPGQSCRWEKSTRGGTEDGDALYQYAPLDREGSGPTDRTQTKTNWGLRRENSAK